MTTYARITDTEGDCNECCTVETATTMLAAGLIESFDGQADGEHFYTMLPSKEQEVIAYIKQHDPEWDFE